MATSGKPGGRAIPSNPRSQKLWTWVRRSAKTVGVVSERLSKTLISPLFSPTKIRPSEANWMTIGFTSPLNTTLSTNPVGTLNDWGVNWPDPPGSAGWAFVSRPRKPPGVGGSAARTTGAATAIDPTADIRNAMIATPPRRSNRRCSGCMSPTLASGQAHASRSAVDATSTVWRWDHQSTTYEPAQHDSVRRGTAV